jgi:hypothetical protein
MRVLAVDPGHTIGLAFVTTQFGLRWSMTIPTDHDGYLDLFGRMVELANPTVVLIEGIPSKFVDEKTSQIFHAVRHWVDLETNHFEIVVVKPAAWKGLVKRVEIPGQHARDAATMAKWYIMKERANG